MSEPATTKQLIEQGLFHHRQADLKTAMERYTEVLRIDPRNVDALYYIALVACHEGQFKQGLELGRRALEVGPPQARVHNLIGKAHDRLGEPLEAAKAYDAALKLDPDFAEAHGNRASLLAAAGMNKEALSGFSRAIALDPKSVPDLVNRGAVLIELGRHAEALDNYNKALALDPDNIDIMMNRANTLVGLKRYAEAEAAFDRVIGRADRPALAYLNKGLLLTESERDADAIACFDAVLAIEPENITALKNKSALLRGLGQTEPARQLIEAVICLEPDDAQSYLSLSGLKRFAPGDPQLAAMETLLDKLEPQGEDRMHLSYALAKAYADTGDHAASFRHLAQANSIKRRQLDYNDALLIGSFNRIAEVFTPALLSDKQGHGNPSPKPIFIVGMPRSGTTLVEQILASHPQVHGAGERPDFRETVERVAKSAIYPDLVRGLTAAQLDEIGTAYLASLTTSAPQAACITDKLPSNFVFVGLIRLVLPDAHIIHVRRDPIDTCYSCFATAFTKSQHFSYDLAELGRFYAAYERIMAHWRSVLPASAMIEVQYEDLVADLETQAQRMVAYCGLQWDARCLAFQKTERAVRTASATQVRQPLYRSSIGRWRPYRNELQPLFTALGLDPD